MFFFQKGKVRLRNWSPESADSWNPNPDLFKTQLCNFIKYCSKGCVRTAEICPFAHSESERRATPTLPKKRRKLN